jgi:two-component system, NarL family, sensor histidine kinase UhpB
MLVGVRHLSDGDRPVGPGFCWTATDSPTLTGQSTRMPHAPEDSRDSRTATAGQAGEGRPSFPSRKRLPLLWWVFVTNGSVLVIAFLLLTLSPITISAPIALDQLALLVAGLALMLALNFVLLRVILSPFLHLTDIMASIDPDRPGTRLAGLDPRTSEGAALARTFNAMLNRLEGARREAARTALSAQEAERARVARELHDEIGQTLTAVMIHAELVADDDSAAASRELGRIVGAVRDSLDEVRRISRELRPEALDDLGLVNALIALCSRVDEQGGPRVKRQLQGKLPPLPVDLELVIYRVAQEGLTNALRHADARTVSVSLTADADELTLTIKDDGKGMPVQPPPGTAGIGGMRERALLVEGRLLIESRPGQGTTVRLSVPLPAGDA